MQWTARLALAGSAGWFVGLYLYIALSRITYPYELEWMEGGSLEQVGRILAGQPLYVKPSLEFIPYIYTPAYFYVAAAASWIGGAGFTPLRVVSLLSSLCCFALVFALVRHESRSGLYGLIAAGLFAATFRLGGGWFDLARVDSLFMALLLGGVLALRLRPTIAGSALAATLFFLSFMTKQPAAVLAAAMAAGCLPMRSGWARLAFPAVFAGMAGLAVAGFDAATAGWFWYYVFRLPAEHTIEHPLLLGFWSHDVFRPLTIAALLTGVFLYRVAARRAGELSFYLALVGGLIGIAWLSRIHSGGYDNVLMPLHAALAIGGGLGVASMRGTRFESAAALACLIQFGLLAYAPANQVPPARDREAGDRLVATIAGFQGDVFIPMHGYLAQRAGKRAFTGGMAFDDVRRGRDESIIRDLETEVGTSLSEGRFDAVILDGPDWGFADAINSGYKYQGRLFDDATLFMPRTGLRTRPQELFVARSGG